VKNVLCDSAADRADLRAEDIIFAINGKPVDSMDAFWQRLGEFAAGDTIRCSVLRAGNRLEKKVWLGPRASGILKF
jgi:S1-C subfamily serine protease